MRRPSFQFYPADWRNNANLRRCSPAARGIWVDVLCVLHDSDEYGVVHWPLADLANSANANIKLIRELVEKNVLKGHDKRLDAAFVYIPRSGRKNGNPITLIDIQDGPVWYSSRMVKDEYVRAVRGESTRFGDSPKDAPKTPLGDGSTSSSSSSPTGSIANAMDADGVKSPSEMTKAELWSVGKSILAEQGMPKAQCGTFVGALVKEFGDAVVVEAVRATCLAMPADAATYLKAACQHGAGQRKQAEPEWRAEQRERTRQAAPGVAVFASQPADQFFIEVETRHVATSTVD